MSEWFFLVMVQISSGQDWFGFWFGGTDSNIISISLNLLEARNAYTISVLDAAAAILGFLKVFLGLAATTVHLAFVTIKLKRLLGKKNRSS